MHISVWIILQHLFAVSLMTGLSVGTLILCGVVFYFLPGFRTLAAMVAFAALCLGGGYLYGDHTGRKFVHAEWDAANAQAAVAEKARDEKVAEAEAAKYQASMAAEKANSDSLQQQVDDYAKELKARKTPAGARALTAADIKRLRNIK